VIDGFKLSAQEFLFIFHAPSHTVSDFNCLLSEELEHDFQLFCALNARINLLWCLLKLHAAANCILFCGLIFSQTTKLIVGKIEASFFEVSCCTINNHL
jgi:hypothetical protein